MSDVPMPKDLSEEAVAQWMDDHDEYELRPVSSYIPLARAVRALVREKVREAVTLTRVQERVGGWTDDDAVIAVVMREEAPRG